MIYCSCSFLGITYKGDLYSRSIDNLKRLRRNLSTVYHSTGRQYFSLRKTVHRNGHYLCTDNITSSHKYNIIQYKCSVIIQTCLFIIINHLTPTLYHTIILSSKADIFQCGKNIRLMNFHKQK